MNSNTKNLHPKFIEALNALDKFPIQDRIHNPLAKKWFDQAFFYAPDDLKKEFHQKADELGLIPASEYCDENGDPVYSAKDIADHFGLSIEEVENKISELQSNGFAVAMNPSALFRKQ